MNSTMAIAQRELIEKRFVLVAATAFLVLALVMPIMPGVHAGQRAAALVVGSIGLSSIFTLGLAAILGSTIVGRDLSDGRLSFYFSKPVAATSIWWGKVLASAALLAACYVIIGFPALVAGAAARSDAAEILAAVPLIAVALFLASHVISTFVRSRSAWFLLDFVALALFAGAIWILTLWLLNGFAVGLLRRLGEIAAVFMSLAVLAAGAWQIARGRTDRRRSHKELSRFLWGTLGCGVLIASGYVAWVVSATPGDIAVPDLAYQSAGPWTFVGGLAKNRMDYHATFLYNIDTGRFLRIPKMPSWWPAGFSRDGKVAVWLVPSQKVRASTGPDLARELYQRRDGEEIHFAQLDSPKPRDIETPLRVKNYFFELSADGSRIVTIDREGILTVDDLRSMKSLGSARIPNGSYAIFVNPDLLRVFAPDKSGISIFEYDVKRKSLTPTGRTPRGGFRFSDDRSRMMLFHSAAIDVYDARSGALLETLPGNFVFGKFLRDGRIVAFGRDQKSLTIFSGGSRIDVPVPADWVYDLLDGPIVACARGGCTVLDRTNGAVVRTEAGIRPLSYPGTATRLLSRWNGELVVWNPVTGEKRPIR